MLLGSFGSVTSVCVCEPRHVCTAATCFGFVMSLMSKMHTPRNRSTLTTSVTPCVPQSIRPRVCSTDMNSRWPYTDMSPWPPGQTTDDSSRGFFGVSMSYVLKPLKFPRKRSARWNAMSELAKSSPDGPRPRPAPGAPAPFAGGAPAGGAPPGGDAVPAPAPRPGIGPPDGLDGSKKP